MALGIVPSSGNWDYRQYDTTSTATFLKGCLVTFSGARTLVERASTDSGYVGIAMSDSANSFPAGKIQVAIPKPGCTAFVDVTANFASSQLSAGQAWGLDKRGNYNSYLTTLATSVFSRIVTIVGVIDLGTRSGNSRIEVEFIQNEAIIGSTSSVSII